MDMERKMRIFAIVGWIALCLVAGVGAGEFLSSIASAQSGQLRPGSIWGNPTTGAAPGRDSTPTDIMDAKGIFYVDDFTTYADFVHDDTPAFTAALAAANAAGGGTVYISPKHYWINTANLTVSRGVALKCTTYGGKERQGLDVRNLPCSLYFNPTYGIILGGRVQDVNILTYAMHTTNLSAASRATIQSFINAFSGTAIKIGDGTGSRLYDNAIVENALIGGFATCIVQSYADQTIIKDILGDCTNGLDISQSYDDNRLNNIEFWPFSTGNRTHSFDSWTIIGAADNGLGVWRLTTSAPNDIATGEQLWVTPGTGAEGAAGLYTVTSVDATHVDLQGSVVSPTTTGTTILGSTYVAVASTADLQPGMTVSGVGIPAGAVIGAVWSTRSAISLDQAHVATAGGAGVALTFASNAYTSGKVLSFDAAFRSGTAFRLGRADGTTCSGCFDFGFHIGFNFNQAVGLSFVNTQHDQFQHAANKNNVNIGVEFTGVATYSNYVSGSMITCGGPCVVSNTTGNAVSNNNVIDGYRLPTSIAKSTGIEIAAGGLTTTNIVSASDQTILIDNTANLPTFHGNSGVNTKIFSTGTYNRWAGTGNYYGGQLEYQGTTNDYAQRYTTTNSIPSGTTSYDMYDATQGVDSKYWRWSLSGGTLRGQTANDAYSSAANWISVTRSANVPLAATFAAEVVTKASATTGAGLNAPHGTAPTTPVNGDIWTTTAGLYGYINGATYQYLPLSSTLSPIFGSSVRINSTAGSYQWYASGAGVDQKFWDLYEGTSGSLAFRSLNDAFSLSNTWLTFNRASGYTIGTISTAAPLTGGTAASSSLILESTSGAGTTDSIVLKTGSQVQAGIFDTTQHFQPGNATAPTIASAACGALTNGAVVAGSNDQAMSITIGAAATTSCAITFAGTWATAPRACMFTPANATAAAQGTTLAYVSSITATTLTITGAALANANYYIHCY
jgi:hypothetical protein